MYKHILYCVSGQEYVDYWLFNSINSILKNNNIRFSFHILTDKDYDFTKIEKILSKNKNCLTISKMEFTEKTDADLKYLDGRGNPTSILFRLLHLKNLETEPDKCLYLDNDVICNGDISGLFNMEFNEPIAVVPEYINTNPEIKKYFNAGVMMLNLKAIDENEVTKICEVIDKDKTNELTDEKLLNIVFQKNKKILDRKFNYNSNYESLMKREEVVFYHFRGLDLKPWEPKFVEIPNYDIYAKYIE